MAKFATDAIGAIWGHLVDNFATNANCATWWPNLDSMQVAFYLAGEITHFIDSIPWVRCASGNVFYTSTATDTSDKYEVCWQET